MAEMLNPPDEEIQAIINDYGEAWYLCGPMSWKPKFNFPAFDAAAANLRARGLLIVSPAELDDVDERERCLLSFDGNPTHGKRAKSYYMRRDLDIVVNSVDGIITLPQWKDSDGGRDETYVAHKLDMPVLGIYPDLELIDPLEHPLVQANANLANGVIPL